MTDDPTGSAESADPDGQPERPRRRSRRLELLLAALVLGGFALWQKGIQSDSTPAPSPSVTAPASSSTTPRSSGASTETQCPTPTVNLGASRSC